MISMVTWSELQGLTLGMATALDAFERYPLHHIHGRIFFD